MKLLLLSWLLTLAHTARLPPPTHPLILVPGLGGSVLQADATPLPACPPNLTVYPVDVANLLHFDVRQNSHANCLPKGCPAADP